METIKVRKISSFLCETVRESSYINFDQLKVEFSFL